ncbi:MAG: GNAT family N-acetyltransferase, partial [Anaerolineaceae bacterium]
MEIRKLQLPKDIDPLAEVSLASFQYPDNPEWSIDPGEAEELRDQVKAIKRYWPLLRVGMLFSSTLRHLFQGYVCYENGRMVGTIMFQQRGGKTPIYYINNVAVHPDSRRKGIARKLVETTLAEMRSQGSCVILLDVIDGNIPAYRLYESLGWEHFSGTVHLLLGADQT